MRSDWLRRQRASWCTNGPPAEPPTGAMALAKLPPRAPVGHAPWGPLVGAAMPS